AVSGPPLRMYAEMVTVDVLGRLLGAGRLESQPETPLQLGLEARRRRPVAEEEELEPGLLAVLAQDLAVPADLGDGLEHGEDLLRADEDGKPGGQAGIGGQPAAHPE